MNSVAGISMPGVVMDASPPEASSSKRVKGETSRRGRPARVRLPRPSKVNAAAKAALEEKAKEALITQPKWKLLPSVHFHKSREIERGTPVTVLKPRLWTTDREELLAILPEMCGPKSVNGVSWLLYENPMLILDDTNAFFEAHKVDDTTMDLVTTRSFVCPVISEPRSKFDESLPSMKLLNWSEEEKPMIDILQTPPTLSQSRNDEDFYNEHTSTVGNELNPRSQFHQTDIGKVEPMDDGDLWTNALVCIDPIPDRYPLPAYTTPELELTDFSEKRSGKRKEDFSNVPSEVAQPIDSGLPVYSDLHCHASLGNQFLNQHASTTGMGPSSDLRSESADCRQLVTVESSERLAHGKSLPVPSPIPQELQALVDAFVFGKPLTVLTSNQRFYDIWSLRLPKEYSYVMLGFFRIIGVKEYRIQSPNQRLVSMASRDYDAGQVRWKFRLQWSSGGEESIFPNRRGELTHAWWSPPPPCYVTKGKGKDSKNVPTDPEDSFPTTLKYRKLRTQNSEYQWRGSHLQDLYYSLFPAHILMPFTSQLPDINFPRGWICSTCGRMNFQAAIRHRKCPGPLCKNSKTFTYHHDLFLLRDPQDRLTLPLPCNSYPHERVDVERIRWEDGTQTFSCFVPDSNKPTCYMKHIFLGNLPPLQGFADEWLKRVQLELEIIRKPGDNGPYFSYSASLPQRDSDPSITKRPNNVPACVNDIKDVMLYRAKWFGEVKELDLRFDQFNILAWVTSGSKKSSQPIRAKKKAALLLCLGSNVGLNINPYSNRNQTSSLQPRIDDQEENTQGHAGWIAKECAEDSIEDFLHDHPSVRPMKRTTASKKVSRSFTFSLVHGDALVLFGDDFEYTIKRDGTAFLLMASCSSSDE